MKKETGLALAGLSDILVQIGIEMRDGKRPGEFTCAEASSMAGLSVARMGSILRDKVRSGALVVRTGTMEGRSVKFYLPTS